MASAPSRAGTAPLWSARGRAQPAMTRRNTQMICFIIGSESSAKRPQFLEVSGTPDASSIAESTLLLSCLRHPLTPE